MTSLMLEHMHKTIIERKGKHGMRYRYSLTNVRSCKSFSVHQVMLEKLNNQFLVVPLSSVSAPRVKQDD